MITGPERRLALLAQALLGPARGLTRAEAALVQTGGRLDPDEVDGGRRAILAGGDPLGARFCAIRPPERRRTDGATYTPAAVVRSMVDWASAQSPTPVRVVDPGSGSGRFLMAAASRFPDAALVGVDTDPLATLMLRANAEVLGFADRLTVELADYREASLREVAGPTLFIGNPPYVRHHGIPAAWKIWYARAAAECGLKASTLAGLHIHFFMRTRQVARQGDIGTFITAGEWMDVNYGSVLRSLLAGPLGGSSIHVIDPRARPFEDALATGTITCFHVGNRPRGVVVRGVKGLEDLGDLQGGVPVPWTTAIAAPKWSVFTRQRVKRAAGQIEVGELFRVHRGQVTGGNDVWIAGAHACGLSPKRLLPAVTKARELLAAGDALESDAHLRRVIDLPADLSELDPSERAAVQEFLRWAKGRGADASYTARARKAWWSVRYASPAPILCTYMARRAPHFVRNLAGARHLNIAHGLYPREAMSPGELDRVAHTLGSCSTTDGGRVYAGGLVKFEPRELERMLIPRPDMMDAPEVDAADLDD